MKRKFMRLSLWCFLLALAIFFLSYEFYHHFTPAGVFTSVWQAEAGKPFVTLLLAIWGVLFLFGSNISLLIALVIYGSRENAQSNDAKKR